ncbi:MAG: hypothetical protein FWG67_00155 [Defluviitaleaceae bacterium]|nr:hypothetical protein [Defluviitaleaceae bacterium]
MTLTENIFHMTKRELLYQWHSKKITLITIILFTLCGIHLFNLYSQVVRNYELYVRTEQRLISEGFDIIEILSEDLDITHEGEGGSVLISNPLKYDFINLSISIQHLEPQNIISNTLEYIVFVFCTLIFGIFASFSATHDFKSKTYKFISIQNTQVAIIIGKLISIIIIKIITLGLALGFTFIGAIITRQLVNNQVPTHLYAMDNFNYIHGLFSQLLLTFTILLFYLIIGFSLGFIFKNLILPTIILFAYGLLIPILGAYDFRNIFSHFAHQVFLFNARFRLFPPTEINNSLGVALLTVTSILLLSLVFLIAKKRDAYS